MKKEKIAKVSTLKTKIRKALKDQGNYSPELEFVIEVTAGNLYAFHLVLSDVSKLTAATLVGKTREGNDKKRAEPALKLLLEHTDAVLKCLRALRLTLDKVGGFGGDEMEELTNLVNNVE